MLIDCVNVLSNNDEFLYKSLTWISEHHAETILRKSSVVFKCVSHGIFYSVWNQQLWQLHVCSRIVGELLISLPQGVIAEKTV